MQEEELNRFDRTLAILVLLQGRKVVKAQQLAQRFNIRSEPSIVTLSRWKQPESPSLVRREQDIPSWKATAFRL